jgi:hypothetical protein
LDGHTVRLHQDDIPDGSRIVPFSEVLAKGILTDHVFVILLLLPFHDEESSSMWRYVI